MRKDLLMRGVELLRFDAADPTGVKFNLATWAAPDDIAPGETVDETVVKPTADGLRWQNDAKVPVSCGTQACAMGLFAISGAFEKEGLGYTITTMRGDLYPIFQKGTSQDEGFQAAEELFEISNEDAAYLFDPDSYRRTPVGAEGELFVADRIERFVNGEIDRDHHPRYRDLYDDEASDGDE